MGTETAIDQVVEILERVRLFQGLPRADLEQIARLMKPKEVGSGEFLFREGDAGDRFYVVFDGGVEILKERPLGDHQRQSVRRAGDAFGELALLTDTPRAESVRALQDTRLMSIAQVDFEALLGGDSLALRVVRGLARALQSRESGSADDLRQFGHQVLRGLEPRAMPVAEGFRVAGARARDDAATVGSLWDAVPVEDGRLVLALLDVKGQALPPAYLVAMSRALLHELAPHEPFERLLGRLNRAIFHNLFDGLDECVEAACVELADSRLRWSRAGHQAGIVIRAGGAAETVEAQGPPLGILPVFDYGALEVDLAPGDTFLAVTEAPDNLVRGAIDLVRSRSDAEPAELAQLLGAALREAHAPGAETDMSFLVVRKT